MHCRSCNHFTHSTGECKCTGSSFFNAAAFSYAKKFHVAIFSMIFKVIVLVSISTLCKCSFRRFSVGSFIIIIPHIIAEQCKTGAKQITKKRKRCQIYGFYKNAGGGWFPTFVLFRWINIWIISNLCIDDVELMRFLILFDFLY